MNIWTYVLIYLAGGFAVAIVLIWQYLSQAEPGNRVIDASSVARSILIWPMFVLAYIAFFVVVLVDKLLGGDITDG